MGETDGGAAAGDEAAGPADTTAVSSTGEASSLDTKAPSALFGDAVEGSSHDTAPTSPPQSNLDAAFASEDTNSFSTGNEAGVSDNNDFSEETFSTHTDASDSAGGEEERGLLSSLWSVFTDDDK